MQADARQREKNIKKRMSVKRKRKTIRLVFTVSLSVMIFGTPYHAAAGDPAFSEAFYANPPPVPELKQAAISEGLSPDLIRSGADEKEEIIEGLLSAEDLMLLSGERNKVEWAPAKMTGPRGLVGPEEAYNRSGVSQPFLGLGWDRDGANRNRWNIVFGLGVYISNYRDRNHPTEDFGLEVPVSDGEQTDFFEKIQNALQVVGFQIRYDF
jgi:hypothetical protein